MTTKRIPNAPKVDGGYFLANVPTNKRLIISNKSKATMMSKNVDEQGLVHDITEQGLMKSEWDEVEPTSRTQSTIQEQCGANGRDRLDSDAS